MSPAVTLRRPGWSASCIALAARAQTAPSPCVAATDSNTPATPEASTAARSAPACAENNVLDLRAQLLQPPRAATQNQTWRALIRAAAAAAAAHRAIPRRGGLDPCRRTSCQGRPRAREKPRAASEIRRRPGCRALQPLRRATGFMNRYRMGARRTPLAAARLPFHRKAQSYALLNHRSTAACHGARTVVANVGERPRGPLPDAQRHGVAREPQQRVPAEVPYRGHVRRCARRHVCRASKQLTTERTVGQTWLLHRCGRRTVDREARERADRVLLNVHARAVHEPYERGDALSGGNGDLVLVCGANA